MAAASSFPVQEWLPGTKKNPDGSIEAVESSASLPAMWTGWRSCFPSRSERVKDMSVVCRKCNTQVIDRFTARCHRCVKDIARATAGGSSQPASEGRTDDARYADRHANDPLQRERYLLSADFDDTAARSTRYQVQRLVPTSMCLRRVIPSRHRPTNRKAQARA